MAAAVRNKIPVEGFEKVDMRVCENFEESMFYARDMIPKLSLSTE